MNRESRVPLSYLAPDWLPGLTIPIFVANELRAVMPVCLLTLLMLVTGGLMPDWLQFSFVMGSYGIGCAAIGAVIFGHDFAHRTLALSLAQPLTRTQLWGTRLWIALVAMIPLAVVAGFPLHLWPQLLRTFFQTSEPRFVPMLALAFLVPPLAGLCIAPWFTLLCRGALAGTVFTVALPFGLLWLGVWMGSPIGQRLGIAGSEQIAFLFFIVSFTGAGVLGFVETWRRFQNLEEIESARASGRFSFDWLARARRSGELRSTGPRSPWLQLASKELHLQVIALVPTFGMLVTAYVVRHAEPGSLPRETLELATACWAAATCIVIGAVGSAEERQMGVTETQALLPVRCRTQWLVKGGVILLLSQLLAVFLPLLAMGGRTEVGTELPEPKWWSLGAMAMVSFSLYLSSFSRTTMKAVMLSLPCAGPLFLVLLAMHENELHVALRRNSASEPLTEWWVFWSVAAPYICFLAMIGLLLTFAARNHFSAEPTGRLRGQLGLICLLFLAEVLFCFSMSLLSV